jgi:hypothetical protein
MRGELHFPSIYPPATPGRALGISLKKDFLVLAVITKQFVNNVEFYAHRASQAVREVPAELHDEFNWTSDPYNRTTTWVDPAAPKLPDSVFPSGTVIKNACAKVEIVGHCAAEQTSLFGDRSIDVTKEQLDTALFKLKLREASFLQHMESGNEGMRTRAKIVRYFYNTPKARQDVIVAICRAYAAQEMLGNKFSA